MPFPTMSTRQREWQERSTVEWPRRMFVCNRCHSYTTFKHSLILRRPHIVQTFRILRFESCWHNSLKYMLDTDRHRCTDGAYYANRGEQTKPSGMKAYNQYSQGQTYSTSRVNGTFSSGTSKRKMAGVKKYANR